MPDDISRRNSDFDDLNRELAGISGNRVARFLGGDYTDRNSAGNKRNANEKALQTQLDLLMMNPAYAAAYRGAGDAIDNAQGLLNGRRTQLAENIERLDELVGDMEDKTAKLDDGTAVFRDSEGRLVTVDGRYLSDAEIVALINPDNALDFDSYKNTLNALNKARARQGKYDDYQDRIDHARKRMDGAPDKDTLDDIQRDMDELMQEMEADEKIAPKFANTAENSAESLVAGLDLESKPTSP